MDNNSMGGHDVERKAATTVRPKLPTSLKLWKYEIERLGIKNGLDISPNIIVMADHEEISELAAYGGYPVRYHHWSFGQDSIRMKKSYRWGLHVIYEMVIPTVPCYSYFLDVNEEVTQKAVIAHACVGHNDFFRNNVWFSDIPHNLHHRFGDNASKVEQIRLEIGKEKVDTFFEACMVLDNIFDLLKPIVTSESVEDQNRLKEKRHPKRIISRDELPYYMDEYINPSEYLEKERQRILDEDQRTSDIERKVVIPDKPIRDILNFFLENGPLEEWQKEIVRITREESLALAKGGQTKIMNEGWAAKWEAHLMAEEGAAIDSEVCSFAKIFAGVQRGSRYSINPYRLGKQLWDDIELRWNTGRHGDIWSRCTIASIKNRWEEFIVFKSLYDEFGGVSDQMFKIWNQFHVLLKETMEHRGFIKKAFFSEDKWILEWLIYKNAEERLVVLSEALDYIIEQEIKYSEEDSDISVFALRYKILTESLHPYSSWSSDELRQEISHCEHYIALRKQIDSGEIPLMEVDIPDEWISWAEKNEFLDQLGRGREKMFEVRRSYNDVTFVQEFFTQNLCDKHGYYTFGVGKVPSGYFWGEDRIVIKSKNYRRVKKMLLWMHVNLGQPKVVIWDANYKNNSELRLIHLFDGRDLCYDGCDNCSHMAAGVQNSLESLYMIWNKNKPVHIESIETKWPAKRPPWYYWTPHNDPVEVDKPVYVITRFTYDGKLHHEKTFQSYREIEDGNRIKDYLPYVPESLK